VVFTAAVMHLHHMYFRLIIHGLKVKKNFAHFPSYLRLDIKVSKTFILFDKDLKVYLDIMNILDRKNVLYYRYAFDEQGFPKIEEQNLFGAIPTIGVSYSF